MLAEDIRRVVLPIYEYEADEAGGDCLAYPMK